MTTLKDYLREKAKFFSPVAEIRRASSTDLTALEIDRLDETWKPKGCRHDEELVNSLIRTLEDHIQARPVEGQDTYDRYFQPFVDEHGMSINWVVNRSKAQSRNMVINGAIAALWRILNDLGYQLQMENNVNAHGFSSLVDCLLYITHEEKKRVLMEIKAPDVFNKMLTFLAHAERTPLELCIAPGTGTDEKVINKMCLYMASHKACWGAITSHEKWVFIRLHPGPAPYITFSPVELQADNTRPFRALLAMMLAAELNLEVESHAKMELPLGIIREEEEDGDKKDDDNDAGASHEDGPGGFKGRRTVGRQEPPVTAREIASLGNWLVTACIDDDQVMKHSRHPELYAIKIVPKGTPQEKNGGIERLHNEFSIYCKLAEVGSDITPRCYGLFESDHMVALVLDYMGEALADVSWSSLPISDRRRIFEMATVLHKFGIKHSDLEPRNIIRGPLGSLAVIDFSQARFHDCPDFREGPRRAEGHKGECNELKSIRYALLGQQRIARVGPSVKVL